MGKIDPAKLAKMFVEFASAERTSNVDMNFLVICTLFEEAIGRGWLSEEQRKLFADRYKTLTAEQQLDILHMLRQQIALRDVTPPGQRSPVSDFLDYISGRAGEETANRCREMIDGGRELEKSILLLLNPIMCEDLIEASAKSVQMDAKEKQIWIKNYRELKRKYEAKFPLYLHTRASRAYHNATIKNDEYRERLLKPERACLEKLLFGDNSGKIPSREEFNEPTPMPPETSRKGMNHFIALGSGTGLIEFANFVVPYSNRFLSTGFKLFCVDTAAHPISMVGLEEILDGKFALQQDATERFRVQNKNELTYGGFNNCVRKVSANILKSRKLRDALEEAIGDDDKDQFGNRPHSTYLLLGRTFGNFDDNVGLLNSIYYTMLPGDELVFSVSAVLRNEDGTKDIESMKLPYEGTYVTEFLTEISMLAGWMDRTVSIEYKLARNGREDDADMLVFKIAGYCTQTASTVEEQVLISKRYDISKRRNQLEEIVRQSKFRHTDVRYVGVDDADKTGVVVAYARKTRKSVWTPRFKKAGAVVGTAAVIAAGLLGIQYYQQLEENTVTPEKAKVMACTADNEGLCSLSSRQDDSSNLFSLVMSSGCNDGKPYGSAAKVIECANSLDPAVLERMRQRLFDEMLQNHFVLFLTEQFGATELLRQIESTNRCRTPLSSLIEPLPPYTRRLAEMTLGYFNIAGALDLSATRADIDSLPDSPQSIEPIVNLAYIYNTRGELDEAIRLYGRAASISEATGFTPLPQISLDDILGKLIDAATADRDFNTLNRNLPEFIARADRVTGWGPYALGHVYLRVREYGNAIDKLNLALEQENRMAEPQHDLRGWVSHKLAEVYTETGHFDIAKRYAHESVAAFNITRNPPGMDWSRIALGRVLADTGSLDDAAEAVRVLDNIQETTNDENARIHSLFHQGRAYLRLGDIEEAKELFRIATDNINAYERDSLRKHYDLFLAEYLTGLALVASGGSESNVLPHFRNAEQHLYDLISISESNTEFSAGVKGMFEIEKLACLRFTSRDAYHKRRSELDSSGFILAHQGLFNEFLLDVYGD